jgi:hypothetical protein
MSAPTATVSGSTSGAGNESGCGTGGDVYFAFTLTQPELVYVDTFGSTFDTELAFASACTGFTTCNDDAQSTDGDWCSTQSLLIQQFTAPGTYYAVVSGYSGASGSFTMHFAHYPLPNGAVSVLPQSVVSSEVSGTTMGTGRVSESCGGPVFGTGPENMYYFATCTDYPGGAYSFSTCGTTTWDTLLSFREGSSTNACNDDAASCGSDAFASMITGNVASGAGLRVVYVDGYDTFESGAYSLTYTVP